MCESGIDHKVYRSLFNHGLDGAFQIGRDIDKSRHSGHSGFSEHLSAFQQLGKWYSEGQFLSKGGQKSGISGARKFLQRNLRFPNKKRK